MYSPVAFRLFDSKTNALRVYGLSEQRGLFDDHCLIITWGRLGQPLRSRTETFDDAAELQARAHKLAKLRLAHGYERLRPLEGHDVAELPIAPVALGE